MGWLSKVLQEHSTKRYFVEYRRYLSNHIAHGIIALERLGATEDRTLQWIQWYNKKLEEPSGKDHPNNHPDDRPISAEELDDITGKRKRFYSILNYYGKKLDDCGGDVDALVRAEFPQLSLGMQATLLHAMIQLGYGYAAKEPTIILEGLAYLRHSYFPVIFDKDSENNDINTFGKGDTEIIDVLYELKRDDELFDYLVQRTKELEAAGEAGDWVASNIQYQIRAQCEKGDKLIGYANKIKVPRDIQGDHVRIADWILHQILTVYVTAQSDRQNDFVLLHGVTCAWSVRQIIVLLDGKEALEALRTLVCMIFAAYIGVGGPKLTNEVDSSIRVNETDWANLIQRTLAAENERDEHVYKLTQICYELWKEPENGHNAALYFTAAKTVLDTPFPPFAPSKPRL
jgi:hypothetical protein